LLQVGSPEQLYQRPASRAVAEFIGRATLVPATDGGDTASVSLGGREVTVRASRGHGAPARIPAALAVLRPETLDLGAADAADAWPGRVVHARFVGGSIAYRVELADGVVCEVSGSTAPVSVGDDVTVRVARGPVALVAA
jgi:ABC-type Fe3+/spermidine/putrescine transport system ATPase subunit